MSTGSEPGGPASTGSGPRGVGSTGSGPRGVGSPSPGSGDAGSTPVEPAGGEKVAAVIGPAHGLRGEVVLDVRTDRAAERLTIGASFATEPADAGPLTLRTLRAAGKGQLASFDEAPDRTSAEALRGVELLVVPDSEPDAWYPHELRGLSVVLVDGAAIGTVKDVEFTSAQDLLVIDHATSGSEVRLPLLARFVPEVDLAGGRITIDPPDGLLP